MPQTPSTRWCPTPEQLMILEEMYRNGVRTPNASQIQQITAHLSLYGKIEGKNVFYWFQNHKARDRQKLRRRLSRHHQLLHQLQTTTTSPLQFHNLEEANNSPSPTGSQLYSPTTTPFHFLNQGGPEEAVQGMNLLSKLDSSDASPPTGTMYGHNWMMMMESSSQAQPLKTLELFPTKSTGLKDECSTSKSSSCSTSTN